MFIFICLFIRRNWNFEDSTKITIFFALYTHILLDFNDRLFHEALVLVLRFAILY